MTKLIALRDDQVPIHLVVLRMGSTTLSDNALSQACERAYASMGVHAFSVFEVPGPRLRRACPAGADPAFATEVA